MAQDFCLPPAIKDGNGKLHCCYAGVENWHIICTDEAFSTAMFEYRRLQKDPTLILVPYVEVPSVSQPVEAAQRSGQQSSLATLLKSWGDGWFCEALQVVEIATICKLNPL